MNEKIMRSMGFGKEVDLVKQGKCVFCKEIVDKQSFKDVISLREYAISGICQKCQDGKFE